MTTAAATAAGWRLGHRFGWEAFADQLFIDDARIAGRGLTAVPAGEFGFQFAFEVAAGGGAWP